MPTQKYTDVALERTVLRFVPLRVTPNQITWVRIVLLPFILFFLLVHQYIVAFILFTIAAFTDSLDGAIARTRNQVTETGKVLDAAADRGLIAVVAVTLLPIYFGWNIVVWIALLEAFNAGMAYRSSVKHGIHAGANWAGKVKMIIQCMAFGMILIALFTRSGMWIAPAYALLLIGLGFTLLEGFLYP